jgi:HPr kinase/phosphorylase
MIFRDWPSPEYPKLRVEELLSEGPEAAGLELVNHDADLKREILAPQIQKPGLVLAGYTAFLRNDRIQIFGGSEIEYLSHLDKKARRAALEPLLAHTVPAIILGKRQTPFQELLDLCREYRMPLLVSPHPSSVLIYHLTIYLEERLAPWISIPGVMLEVYGVGTLLAGKSGIGKSECALSLVSRGHRLVGDDQVVLRRRESGVLVAEGKPNVQHWMEIRGLGIVNVLDLFGMTAIRQKKEVDLVISLEKWEEGKQYDRLGIERETCSIMGLALPLVRIPVDPGRNLGVLIEVAARTQILIRRGLDPGKEFARLLDRQIAAKGGAGA